MNLKIVVVFIYNTFHQIDRIKRIRIIFINLNLNCLNKPLKYTLGQLEYYWQFLFLLYIVVFIYVSVNKKSIIKQVTQEIGKKLNGNCIDR